jgi:hypothetical protein
VYKVSVVSESGPFAQVGDREIPRRYEMVWTPDEDEPRPAVRLVFEVIDGAPQCRGVHFESTEHGREIRRVDLDFPLEDYLAWATATVGQLAHGGYRGEHFEVDLSADPFLRAVRQSRRSMRRRGPSDKQLREAVEVYRAAGRAPTQAVAERFDIAPRTASLWMTRAREKGLM